MPGVVPFIARHITRTRCGMLQSPRPWTPACLFAMPPTLARHADARHSVHVLTAPVAGVQLLSVTRRPW